VTESRGVQRCHSTACVGRIIGNWRQRRILPTICVLSVTFRLIK